MGTILQSLTNLKSMDSKAYNYHIENTKLEEFPQLKGSVYVDHAGATLYSKSQIDAVHKDLTTCLYGNPHSNNASSRLATDTVDQIRYRLLKFFNTNPDDYSLIFTSGCTASLKIIADGFNFSTGATSSDSSPAGVFCYLDDSHTSVQGMREAVAHRASHVVCVGDQEIQETLSNETITNNNSTQSTLRSRSLVAFPAQSNFNGRKYPLDWVKLIQKKGLCLPGKIHNSASDWFVLLDAAAFVSTNKLDLSEVQPDFVTLSFYKIFGYPTGLGALLVHQRAKETLHKRYFSGGTVAVSVARQRFHSFRTSLHEKFEDGTIPYLSIISLRHGLDTLEHLGGGMEKISSHVFAVAQYFYNSLHRLRHGNGEPLATVYCEEFTDSSAHGGVVTFNLKRADGTFIGFAEVDKFAQLHDVHLRTGCFCNIGACQKYLGLTEQVIMDNFKAGHVCGDNMDLIDGQPTGAVRISFGYMSTLADALTCLRFIADTFLEKPVGPVEFPYPDWYTQQSVVDKMPGVVLENTHTSDNVAVKATNIDSSLNSQLSSETLNETGIPTDPVELSKEVSLTCSSTSRKVTDIMLYPLKSCGAFRTTEWEMGEKGLLYDREWILVTDTGVTVGQKREPRICMLCPSIDLDARKLILTFPDASPFHLPLDQDAEFDAVASFCSNKVCGDRVNTFDCGDAVSDWLSDIFQTPGIRLLRQQSDDTRTVKLKDKIKSDGGQVDEKPPRLSMANESQLLVLSRASVKELQAKMAAVAMETADDEHSQMPTAPTDITADNLIMRFRGNLVIGGGEGFDEDSWELVRVGGNSMVCHGVCSRCQMICMDQLTAQKSREPLRTLSVWRGKRVPFGIYSRLLPRSDGAKQIIRVGDVVTVLENSKVK